ncbi:DNA mismatch repair endonuclease MutL [Lactobacillus sp. ESL0791]|uniref:DNA mismatch repair endonuclease MutL n=1 Tax=Lactobacillus sp. ESL0791 TaxID=2983234 RepID=UPI0023F994D7|nr:DNA mismatch repair endonuclease MutL [Lactobacillus sp. ESL0791]MDF7638432.1 DNA mismatch repair endonuclease MutL [Lactobacillus sp. ESL0791]
MAQIHELSENLSNQIAAGEVIERPASVVKELVENALDAGATRIRVEFIDAGLKQIIVQDNGSGIAADQIDLAFTRHATSKINNEHDLFNVATLGFRGEALASIAAVSHVEILTSTKGQTGTRAAFSAGVKKDQGDAAARKGTQITVNDLFYNTPARLKYLRSARTESMQLIDIVDRIALGYPDVAFTLVNSGKILLHTAGNGDLQQTAAQVYGRRIAQQMFPFKNQDNDFKISGLLSKPELTRSTRNFVSLLLNGRYIKNFNLTSALMEGYGSQLANKHYPVAIIAIHVDPLLVDVNVHPTKREVRLSKEKELGRLLTSTVSSALAANSGQIDAVANVQLGQTDTLVDQLKFNLNKDVVDTKRMNDEVHEDQAIVTVPQENNYVDLNKPRQDDRYLLTATWDDNVAKQSQLTPFTNDQSDLTVISAGDESLANNLPELTYVGQTGNLLLAENHGDLFLLDQVAARRRVAFNKIKQVFTGKKITQQGLLTPLVLEFNNLDFIQIKDQLPEIEKIGLFLADFGDHTFILRSYPTWLSGDIEQAVREILDSFLNVDQASTASLFNRIASQQAKREVSGRSKLSTAEATGLLQALRKTSDPYHDGEGNLVVVRIGQSDLRRMFKKDK